MRSFFYAWWAAFLTCFKASVRPKQGEKGKRLHILKDGQAVYSLPESASADYCILPKSTDCPKSCFRVKIEPVWPAVEPGQVSLALHEIATRLFGTLKLLRQPDKKSSTQPSFSIVVGETEFLGVQFGTASILAVHDAVVATLPIYAASVVRVDAESEVFCAATSAKGW